MAWQPSTWPELVLDVDLFVETLGTIFGDSLVSEIKNVIADALEVNGDLQHRGHVVALALFCAVDTLASYAFKGKVGYRYVKYIEVFFPSDYRPHARGLYKTYRNSLVHSWNLFEVGITPGHEPIRAHGNSLQLGLLNFFDALEESVRNFLGRLKSDNDLMITCQERYTALRKKAAP